MTADRHAATAGERERVVTDRVGSARSREGADHHQTTLPGCAEPGAGEDGAVANRERVTASGSHERAATSGSRERVNAFPIRERVLVRHYFDDDAFEVVAPYYDRRNYRFDLPRGEFRRVRATLDAHGYDLRLVEELAPYAVVVRKYSEHPEVVFETAVVEFANDDYNVFVLADEPAVRAAVEAGAERLADAPVAVRFPTAHGTGPLTVADLAVE